MEPLGLATAVAAVLDAKKAEQLRVIRITDISSLADYFVIASGTSNTHVRALADETEEKLLEKGVSPLRVEGYRSNSWVLLDYEDVVVHIFTPEAREFFDLDRLWADGEPVELQFPAAE